jgi:hypothetical protein
MELRAMVMLDVYENQLPQVIINYFYKAFFQKQ